MERWRKVLVGRKPCHGAMSEKYKRKDFGFRNVFLLDLIFYSSLQRASVANWRPGCLF